MKNTAGRNSFDFVGIKNTAGKNSASVIARTKDEAIQVFDKVLDCFRLVPRLRNDVGAIADIVGRLFDRVKSSTDIVGRLFDRVKSSADIVGRLFDRVKSSADIVGRSFDRVKSSADIVGRSFDRVKSSVDIVGRLFDRVKSSADIAGRSFDRIKSSADIVGRLFNLAKSSADIVGRSFNRVKSSADIVGRLFDRVKSSADIVGRSTDTVDTQNTICKKPALWVRLKNTTGKKVILRRKFINPIGVSARHGILPDTPLFPRLLPLLRRGLGGGVLLFTITAHCQPIAFPGAEGFGKHTTGGRGGKVLFVDNLNDRGAGSLREAVRTKGARTVLFRVSGTIYLESALEIKHDSLTLAGQTAPGDGVCIAGYPVKLNADNIIIRYLRFRLGDVRKTEDDAISASRQRNIIIDHCSMSWSTDECASFYDNENFTLQWSILSESLRRSVHVKGAHGYGGIWGGKRATFHHNLLAHHSSRNPRFCGARYHESTRDAELADFRNNVIYNWGFNSSYAGENGQYNVVNNYYKPGPATQKRVRARILEAWQSKDGRGFHDFGRFYVAGNVMDGDEAITANNWEGVHYKLYIEKESVNRDVAHSDSLYHRCRSAQPFEYAIDTRHTAQEACEAVLQHAGASLVRDTVDRRIVGEVRNGIFTYGDKGMIDSQTQVGGWPELVSRPAPPDADSDGMPDAWEDAHGLDKNNPADNAAYTLSPTYTNLEEYINEL